MLLGGFLFFRLKIGIRYIGIKYLMPQQLLIEVIMKCSVKLAGLSFKGVEVGSGEIAADCEIEELVKYAEQMKGFFDEMMAQQKEESLQQHARRMKELELELEIEKVKAAK